MKNLMIMVLLAVAVLVIIFLINTKNKNTESINNDLTTESSDIEGVANKIYTNSKYEFSLTYPGYYVAEKETSLNPSLVFSARKENDDDSLYMSVTEESLDGYRFNVYTGDLLYVEYKNDLGWFISDSQDGFTLTDNQKQKLQSVLPHAYTTKNGYTAYFWPSGDGGTIGMGALIEAPLKNYIIQVGISDDADEFTGNLEAELKNILDTLAFD